MKLLTKEIEKKLPPLYSCEQFQDPMCQVKFFTPDSSWTWFVLEYDPKQQLFFGYVVGPFPELGYFQLNDLESAKGPLGLHIERDMSWQPVPLSKVMEKVSYG